jgi:hypothetical protein
LWTEQKSVERDRVGEFEIRVAKITPRVPVDCFTPTPTFILTQKIQSCGGMKEWRQRPDLQELKLQTRNNNVDMMEAGEKRGCVAVTVHKCGWKSHACK